MKRADYKCEYCDNTRERWFEGTAIPPTIEERCDCLRQPYDDCGEYTTWSRVWTPVSTGRGSSGEPPR